MQEQGRTAVTVSDIDMPFGSMVKFMIKLAVASIPAFIILMLLGAAFGAIMTGVVAPSMRPESAISIITSDTSVHSIRQASAPTEREHGF